MDRLGRKSTNVIDKRGEPMGSSGPETRSRKATAKLANDKNLREFKSMQANPQTTQAMEAAAARDKKNIARDQAMDSFHRAKENERRERVGREKLNEPLHPTARRKEEAASKGKNNPFDQADKGWFNK